MWRKPTEAKPSSQAPNTPTPAPGKAPAAEPSQEKSGSAPAVTAQSALATQPAPTSQSTPATPAPQSQPAIAAAVAAPAAVTPAPSAEATRSSPAPAAQRREASAEGRTSSTVSAGLKIRGEILGDTDLYVDGNVQGKIRMTNARVTIGPNGHVQADVEAREIVVEGTLEGGLKASESVRLGDGSRVQGSVLSPRIAIADGARFRGNVEMVRVGADTAASPARAGSAPQAARAASASGESE